MLHKLRSRAQGDAGFTLIELLVVILIIGILAAIALPAFLGQRQKAQDANAKSVVRTAATAAETYFTDGESYSGMDIGKLQAIEPTLPGDLTVTPSADGKGYELTEASKTNTTFTIKRDASTSQISRSCSGSSAGCKNSSW